MSDVNDSRNKPIQQDADGLFIQFHGCAQQKKHCISGANETIPQTIDFSILHRQKINRRQSCEETHSYAMFASESGRIATNIASLLKTTPTYKKYCSNVCSDDK